MSVAGPVRLAVVGVGHLGRQHARVAAQTAGIVLVGVQDHHEGRAEEVAREQGTTALSGPEEVAGRADAVVVATPTSTHAALASFFLERGLDVLVEKPIATGSGKRRPSSRSPAPVAASSRSATSSATTPRWTPFWEGSTTPCSSRATGSACRRRAASTSMSSWT